MNTIDALNTPRTKALSKAITRWDRVTSTIVQLGLLTVVVAIAVLTRDLRLAIAVVAAFGLAFAVFASIGALIAASDAMANVRNLIAFGATPSEVTALLVRQAVAFAAAWSAVFGGAAIIGHRFIPRGDADGIGWFSTGFSWTSSDADFAFSIGRPEIELSTETIASGSHAPLWPFLVACLYVTITVIAAYPAGAAHLMLFHSQSDRRPWVRNLIGIVTWPLFALASLLGLFPLTIWLCNRMARRYRQDLAMADK